MRTTLTLEDDVHAFAQIYANSRGITLSAALNELVRKAEVAHEPVPEISISPLTGLPIFPRRSGRVTPELVKQLEEEEYDPKAFA